ncbi:MAG: metalloregulator ArsR/SmtB family transcription factor [Acidimicrobiia bacterium]|jgi:DNA-binding transcriptional ArsR family regulator
MNASTFAALGEPSRLRIVELLRERSLAVGDLAKALDIRQPQVSKHLRVLRDAGLVAVERDARRRINHLRAEAFADIGNWVDSFERLWEERLDRLGTYLQDTEEEVT